MSRIYKLMLPVIASMLIVLGCTKKEKTAAPAPVTPQEYTGIIGISKIIAHPALDAVERGVMDELKVQGYINLKYDIQSANGEISTAASIANKYKTEKVLVAVGIATNMAQALATNMKDTPVVFSAVTDPIDAGLRKNKDMDNTNVTGVSDMTPVREQIELAARLKNVKKLGFIYNAGESNSVVLYGMTKAVCDSMGIELVATTVTNTAEVKQATEVIAPKVDLIYASTDNVVYASLPSLVPTAAKYNVPVVASVPEDNAGTGILAAYGINYYIAGRETGKLVARILKGEKAGSIPVKYMTLPSELDLYVDESVAAKMGITIPEDIAERAQIAD